MNPLPAPSRPAASAFLSDAWYRACIESWTGRARFRHVGLPGTAGEHGQRVAALMGIWTELRHGLLPVRVRALNQSAVPALDQPWIEHNGFFGGRPEDFGLHLEALLRALEPDPRWDELRLGGLAGAHADEARRIAGRAGLVARVVLTQPSFQVDLDAVRERHAGDYPAVLSANTRQQLRRSRRLAERVFGTLRLEPARSADEAHGWFDATAPLHRARWRADRAEPYASGFDNPAFVDFHHRLIGHAFGSGAIQYMRLTAGDRTLAYLYNLVHAGHVHFYLSGIDYAVDEGMRPGLLAHWLAVEHNLAAGHGLYDFLAGDARYKRSLSTHQDRMQWLVLQRPRWRLRLEDIGRHLRQQWAQRAHRAPSRQGSAGTTSARRP